MIDEVSAYAYAEACKDLENVFEVAFGNRVPRRHCRMQNASITEIVMERVLGIGGFFFRAQNPDALAEWYRTHLGIDPVPSDYADKPWSQEAGPTAFAPFPSDSEYFGSSRNQWMINFRVRNLDAMVAQLRAAGLEVVEDPEIYPNGCFARLHDPEGNPVELWEPR